MLKLNIIGNLIYKINKNYLLLYFILSASIFALIIAHFLEFTFDLPVCKLCLYQRITYYLLIVIISSHFILYKDNIKFTKITIYSSFILLFINFIISIYHILIIKNIIQITSCSKAIDSDFFKNIYRYEFESCSEVNFYIFSLSIPELSNLYLIIIILTSLYIFFKKI